MALTKFLMGKNEDGTPHWFYHSDDPTKPVVITGPPIGTVETSDGTVYNVSEPVIEVDAGHNGEVAHLIGMRNETEGHPKHPEGDEAFLHTCDEEHCGVLAIPDKLAGGPLAAKRTASIEELATATAPKGAKK